MTPEQLAASLIADVPRRVIEDGGDPLYHGKRTTYLPETKVLAALATAMGPDDLVEQAGKLTPELRKLAWSFGGETADLITALLARLAAQEAQIKGLTKERDQAWKMAAEADTKLGQHLGDALETKTALAAERAKVARLVEALGEIKERDKRVGGHANGEGEVYYVDGPLGQIARAAITEAGQ